jgi:hypothetical protein
LKTSVGLFDLVEEHHRVRPPAHRLGQLPGVLVPHVAGRGTDQPADRVPLLKLRHVQPDHPVLVADQRLGKGPRQFGLADAAGAEEQETADRPVRVPEAHPGATDSLGDHLDHLDHLDRLVLADHPLVQVLLELKQAFHLFLGQLADRDAGGPGHHLGDVLDADLGDGAVAVTAAARLLESLLGLCQLVAQLRGSLVLLRRDRLVLLTL